MKTARNATTERRDRRLKTFNFVRSAALSVGFSVRSANRIAGAIASDRDFSATVDGRKRKAKP